MLNREAEFAASFQKSQDWLRSDYKVTMSTINQKRANRLNAKKSTGPTTEAGKEKSRFNALVHGLRAESTLLPGEDVDRFDQLLDSITVAWRPQDDMERSLIEQIAANQWKLARLDRAEARIHNDTTLSGADFATAISRFYLTQARLERNISRTILDLERYRKQRLERAQEKKSDGYRDFRPGLVESMNDGPPYFRVQPQIYGLDNVWRFLPRVLLGDFSGVPDHDRLPNNQDPPDPKYKV